MFMNKVKKLQKELVKLDEEQLKEVLGFLTDEDEEEEPQGEPDVKETKEENQEEKQVASKKEEDANDAPVALTKKDLEELLGKFAENFVQKKELEEVKEESKKQSKQAFGVDTKTPPPKDNDQTFDVQSLLAQVNERFR